MLDYVGNFYFSSAYFSSLTQAVFVLHRRMIQTLDEFTCHVYEIINMLLLLFNLSNI